MFRVIHPFPLILALAGILLAGCGQSSSAGVAAIVNGHQVPLERYNLLYNLSLHQSGATKSAAASQAMNQVILFELVQEYANSHHITVSNTEIDNQRNAFITQLGGQTKYQAWLKQNGVTDSQMRELFAPSLLGQKVEAAVAPASQQKTLTAKVEHILIATSGHRPKPRTDAQALALARSVLKMVQHGGNFAQLATEYSDDPGSASNGGVYTVTPGEMVKPFDNASFHLPLHHPAIIHTQYGYHVIEVLSRGLGPVNPQQAQQKQQAAFQTWLQQQMSHAKIKRIAKA